MGRNGMGKTTSVHCIMGIVPTSAGRITWEDQIITNLPSYRIAQAGIGLVPEGRQVFPNLSVIENLVAASRSGTGHAQGWDVERVFQMFPALAARRDGLGNLLSGGDARHRQSSDDQPSIADSRRGYRRPGTVGTARDLVLLATTKGRWDVDTRDRQERSRPGQNCRSTLHHREGADRLVWTVVGTAYQRRHQAPIPGHLSRRPDIRVRTVRSIPSVPSR